MNNYKLVNQQTNEETICDKVTIDGFDYYVSDTPILTKDYYYDVYLRMLHQAQINYGNHPDCKKVIATNNPNIDIPKVVDEVTKEAERDWIHKEYGFEVGYNPKRCVDGAVQKPKFINGFVKGYNKSQETHPFSDDDMKSFGKFCRDYDYTFFGKENVEEMLRLWKEDQTKTVYYG